MQVDQILTDFPELPMCAGIYAIYNTVERKAYIGKATRLTRRLSDHFQMLLRGTHINPAVQDIAQRTGPANWRYFVLEIVADETRLTERERYWIGQFDPDDTYNIA